MNVRWVFCCLFLLCGPLIWAGDNTSPNRLAHSLKGKVVFLRGMQSGDKLNFDAQGAEIGADTTGAFAYSAVKIEKVQVSGSEFDIEGERVALIFQSASESPSLKDIRFVPLNESTDIDIAVDPQHPEEVDAAVKRIFASDPRAVLFGMSPEDEAAALNSLGSTAPVNPPNSPVSGLVSRSALVIHDTGEKGLSPPVLIYSVDPAANLYATQKKPTPDLVR